jgi:Protein of unknown function (DUF2735)
MATSSPGESAKIYTFPARGRFAAGNQRDDLKPAANAALPRGVMVASGSGWYHDEAIQAEQRRKS